MNRENFSIGVCLGLFERFGITFEINDGKIITINRGE